MDKLFTDHPEWIKSKMLTYAHPRLDCLHPELDLEQIIYMVLINAVSKPKYLYR